MVLVAFVRYCILVSPNNQLQGMSKLEQNYNSERICRSHMVARCQFRILVPVVTCELFQLWT